MNTSTPQFTPADIVFSFAAISDWHIKDEDGQYNQQKLISALAQLREKAAEDDPRGLAAVVAAGDMTHDGTQVGEYGYMSEFYRHPDCRAASYEARLTLPPLPAGDYTVTVRAKDCWGNEAKPLVGWITIE